MTENEKGTTALATTGGNSPVLRTEGFGGMTQMQVGETSALAMAEQAKAAVQARYLMAMRKPRVWDEVRSALLHECERTSFAATARYAKPVGEGKVQGFSVRFAEAAIRAMTNLLQETYVVYDDQEKRTIRVMVTDLESNATWSKDAVIQKVVERKKLKEGQPSLGKRLNSYGQIVYLVSATEDDLLNKLNSAESKLLRNHALRLVPGDILDECKAMIERTMSAEITKDPDAERKKIADAFRTIGVKVTDIVEYLGHDLDRLQPAELAELRIMHQAIKDGEATWDEFVEAEENGDSETKKSDEHIQKVKDQVRDRVAAKTSTKSDTKTKSQTMPKSEEREKDSQKSAAPKESGDKKISDAVSSTEDETVRDMTQAYQIACKVLKIHELNSVLKAAQLPIAPYEKWQKDELVYGIYLMNEIADKGGAPAFPDVPFWLNEEQGEVWGRNYRVDIGKAGLMREGELTA